MGLKSKDGVAAVEGHALQRTQKKVVPPHEFVT